jgi:membrane fusion protein, multidrug efflux system
MEKNKIHIYLYNALIVLCLLGGAVYVVSQFMHFGGGEFTDNARVRQNVVPQPNVHHCQRYSPVPGPD